MLNYNSPIKNEVNHNDISMKEISPVMKLNLRGKKKEFSWYNNARAIIDLWKN